MQSSGIFLDKHVGTARQAGGIDTFLDVDLVLGQEDGLYVVEPSHFELGTEDKGLNLQVDVAFPLRHRELAKVVLAETYG